MLLRATPAASAPVANPGPLPAQPLQTQSVPGVQWLVTAPALQLLRLRPVIPISTVWLESQPRYHAPLVRLVPLFPPHARRPTTLCALGVWLGHRTPPLPMLDRVPAVACVLVASMSRQHVQLLPISPARLAPKEVIVPAPQLESLEPAP